MTLDNYQASWQVMWSTDFQECFAVALHLPKALQPEIVYMYGRIERMINA